MTTFLQVFTYFLLSRLIHTPSTHSLTTTEVQNERTMVQEVLQEEEQTMTRRLERQRKEIETIRSRMESDRKEQEAFFQKEEEAMNVRIQEAQELSHEAEDFALKKERVALEQSAREKRERLQRRKEEQGLLDREREEITAMKATLESDVARLQREKASMERKAKGAGISERARITNEMKVLMMKREKEIEAELEREREMLVKERERMKEMKERENEKLKKELDIVRKKTQEAEEARLEIERERANAEENCVIQGDLRADDASEIRKLIAEVEATHKRVEVQANEFIASMRIRM